MSILALDSSGTPRQWITDEQAIMYHATNSVMWSMGDVVARYRGGVQRDGTLSYIESSSIIAVRGSTFNPKRHSIPMLTNKTLFGRDRHLCAYCGKIEHNHNNLSRDHIMPKSRGGLNTWMNCVTACRTCNSEKSNRTPKEAGLELLYVPYIPNHYESMILQNRNILADQMDYLMSGVPRHSRLAQ